MICVAHGRRRFHANIKANRGRVLQSVRDRIARRIHIHGETIAKFSVMRHKLYRNSTSADCNTLPIEHVWLLFPICRTPIRYSRNRHRHRNKRSYLVAIRVRRHFDEDNQFYQKIHAFISVRVALQGACDLI